jgi:hypothetical protein
MDIETTYQVWLRRRQALATYEPRAFNKTSPAPAKPAAA